ncbi:hypothetical protein GCM10023093_23520 [Nemorincola caseinilytica]|uniref:Uncharacterized protein n=1 Tax=Nemorincola caseinilytica TaxID=2054315 RepID=A0ABP8NLM8_9BACT
MLQIFVVGYLAYRNSVRAKQKGVSGWLWAVATVMAFFSALFIGCLFVVFNFCTDSVNVDLLSSTDPAIRQAVSEQLRDVLSTNWLHVLTIQVFGIGGYLLVRYILERKPDKKEPEIHWMDKLGN